MTIIDEAPAPIQRVIECQDSEVQLVTMSHRVHSQRGSFLLTVSP
jgi:hypothetical protein